MKLQNKKPVAFAAALFLIGVRSLFLLFFWWSFFFGGKPTHGSGPPIRTDTVVPPSAWLFGALLNSALFRDVCGWPLCRRGLSTELRHWSKSNGQFWLEGIFAKFLRTPPPLGWKRFFFFFFDLRRSESSVSKDNRVSFGIHCTASNRKSVSRKKWSVSARKHLKVVPPIADCETMPVFIVLARIFYGGRRNGKQFGGFPKIWVCPCVDAPIRKNEK